MAFRYGCEPSVLGNPYVPGSVKISAEQFGKMLRDLCYRCAFGTTSPGLKGLLVWRNRHPQYRGHGPKKYWGIKTFPNEQQAAGLRWLYPQAKFLLIVRNGMDVVQSMSGYGYYSQQSFEERCRTWNTVMMSYRFLGDRAEALTLGFEDLLGDPAAVLARVWGHLELAADPAPAHFLSSTFVHTQNNPVIKESDPLVQLRNRSAAYQDWSSEEKAVFKELCAESMAELRYDIPF